MDIGMKAARGALAPILLAAGAVCVFWLQGALPAGTGLPLLYPLLVLAGLALAPALATQAAVACSLLIGLSVLLLPGDPAQPWHGFLPHALSAALLWGIAGVGARLAHRERRAQARCRELAEANEALCTLARRDHLTRLANRRHLDEQLAIEYARAARDGACLSLAMIDVDHFKTYNDLAGHAEGDRCLARIAQALCVHLRRPGDLVARYGGEEFALLLPGADLEGAIERGEAVRVSVQEARLHHPDASCGNRVSVSVGVATIYPSRMAGDPALLIETADRALYAAKAQGRNCVRAIACRPQREARIA